CDRVLGCDVVAVRRCEPRAVALERPFSRRERLRVAALRGARVVAAAADRRTDPAAPDARRGAPPHAVRRGTGDREEGGRDAYLPRVRAALAGARVRRRSGAVSDGGSDPDQPDLAVGAVSRVAGDEWCAAGLVSRLADRRSAARAELR